MTDSRYCLYGGSGGGNVNVFLCPGALLIKSSFRAELITRQWDQLRARERKASRGQEEANGSWGTSQAKVNKNDRKK